MGFLFCFVLFVIGREVVFLRKGINLSGIIVVFFYVFFSIFYLLLGIVYFNFVFCVKINIFLFFCIFVSGQNNFYYRFFYFLKLEFRLLFWGMFMMFCQVIKVERKICRVRYSLRLFFVKINDRRGLFVYFDECFCSIEVFYCIGRSSQQIYFLSSRFFYSSQGFFKNIRELRCRYFFFILKFRFFIYEGFFFLV